MFFYVLCCIVAAESQVDTARIGRKISIESSYYSLRVVLTKKQYLSSLQSCYPSHLNISLFSIT